MCEIGIHIGCIQTLLVLEIPTQIKFYRTFFAFSTFTIHLAEVN